MKVLVADDNALIRELLRQALVPLDWEIEVLSEGEAAVAYLSALEEPVVALIDIELPGVSGIEIAKKFSGRHAEHAVFVMLVTTKCDPVPIEEGLHGGAVDVIVLPSDPMIVRARAYVAARMMLRMATSGAHAGHATEGSMVVTEPNVRVTGTTLKGRFLKFSALGKAPDYILEAIVGMGFAKARFIDQHVFAQSEPSYASWCCIVAPNCGVWVDVLVETDRNIAMDLFEKLTGVPADCAKDATDTLGEIVNLIQGGIKSALQAEGHETMTPVVPKPVPGGSLRKLNEHMPDRVRVVVDIDGLVFCVTLFVFNRPMIRKSIEGLRQRDVTAEALPMPHGVDLKMLNRGVMLDDRWITNLRNRFVGDSRRLSCNVVEPPPLINLLTGLTIKADA
ncbi:MAG: response regulator [Verrucomicrobiota bacterium]